MVKDYSKQKMIVILPSEHYIQWNICCVGGGVGVFACLYKKVNLSILQVLKTDNSTLKDCVIEAVGREERTEASVRLLSTRSEERRHLILEADSWVSGASVGTAGRLALVESPPVRNQRTCYLVWLWDDPSACQSIVTHDMKYTFFSNM